MKREQRHGLWQQPPNALLGGLGLALLTVVCYRLENLSPDGVPISFADGHIRNLPRLTGGPFRYKTPADVYLEIAQRYAQVPLKQEIGRASCRERV